MNPEIAFVVAHFDSRGHVPAHLHNLLQMLATLTPRIVFVSTKINSEQAQRVSRYAKVISRENYGYDFWSYKVGIDELGDLGELKKLVILNSSFVTINPSPLRELFKRRPEGPGLRGLTASGEISWHAQSFCISFENKEFINSALFSNWWQKMTPVSDKVEVVHQYEVGMSKYFIEQNIPVVGVFEPTWNDLMLAAARAFETGWWRPDFNARIINLDLEVARTLNPTHFLWDRVLEQFSIIKVDILRRGHPRGLNLLRFESAMRDSPALADLIRDATGE